MHSSGERRDLLLSSLGHPSWPVESPQLRGYERRRSRRAVRRRRGRVGGCKAEAPLSKTCRSKTGRSRLRADELIADRAYDTTGTAARGGRGGVKPVIARRHARPSTGSGLGRRRWVVERAFVWLH